MEKSALIASSIRKHIFFVIPFGLILMLAGILFSLNPLLRKSEVFAQDPDYCSNTCCDVGSDYNRYTKYVNHWFCDNNNCSPIDNRGGARLLSSDQSACFTSENCGAEQIDVYGTSNPNQSISIRRNKICVTPTRTEKPTATPTPARPIVCQSLNLTTTSYGGLIKPNSPVTLILKAYPPPAGTSIASAFLAFYNRQNLYPSPPPDNPKPIFKSDGTQKILEGTLIDSSTYKFTVNYSDIDQPDYNWSKGYPDLIRVNGYFRLSDRRVSAVDARCIQDLTKFVLTSPTPTKRFTPTPTRRFTPTPTKRFTPTPTKKLSPTPTTVQNQYVNCNTLNILYVKGSSPPTIGDVVKFKAYGSAKGIPITQVKFTLYRNGSEITSYTHTKTASYSNGLYFAESNNFTIANSGTYKIQAKMISGTATF